MLAVPARATRKIATPARSISSKFSGPFVGGGGGKKMLSSCPKGLFSFLFGRRRKEITISTWAAFAFKFRNEILAGGSSRGDGAGCAGPPCAAERAHPGPGPAAASAAPPAPAELHKSFVEPSERFPQRWSRITGQNGLSPRGYPFLPKTARSPRINSDRIAADAIAT